MVIFLADNDEFLTRKQAALYLHKIGCPIGEGALGNMAANNNAGAGPSFTRVGWRHVRYTKADLDVWAAKRTVRVE
jgi:hypothetical protein